MTPSETARRRVWIYWSLGLGLTLGSVALRGSTWRSGAEFHTVLETIATLLALAVGALALLRFYSRKNNTFLFIGVGFLATASLDGYHAIVSSSYFRPFMPSDLPSLIPWSWVASRMFLAILVFLSWVAWTREQRLGEAGRIAESTVYLMIVLLAMASFFIFAFVPLPRAYYPEIPFHRPEEFVPAVFFLLALIGYLRKGEWRRDTFEHWLVLSLIVGFVGQAVFMSFSGQLFDFGFDAAHALKKVSYLCVLTGLLISMSAMFRRAEESGERTRAIVEGVFDGIVTIDAAGTVTAFNEAGERTFGYSADEVIGRNVRLLMPEPDHGQHDQYLRNYLETGEAKIIGIGREVVGRRKDGRQFPMDLAVTEMAVGGRRMFVGVCRDVTERKRAEERIVAANRELDAFAYSVSHDLRAPLRGLDGFSLALIEDYGDSLDDQARNYLGRIRAASQRMGQLIDDLLRLSRSTRGEMKMEEVDLSSVAESIVSELCRREPGRNVAVEIAPRLVAHGDAKLLRILLENLIGNAWKFTSRKDAARIEFGAEREGGRPIYFVRDDGAGFDMAYGDKLFSAFQRLHGTNEFEGTGIGLATCTRIVHRHGGEISADGAVGKGATFSFTLAT